MFAQIEQTPALTYLCQYHYIVSIIFNEDLLVVDRSEGGWTIKMAPPGTGSKVKNMQFKVQTKPSEDSHNKKCSKVCNMKFRILFSWKSGKENRRRVHRHTESIKRELPKVNHSINCLWIKTQCTGCSWLSTRPLSSVYFPELWNRGQTIGFIRRIRKSSGLF